MYVCYNVIVLLVIIGLWIAVSVWMLLVDDNDYVSIRLRICSHDLLLWC